MAGEQALLGYIGYYRRLAHVTFLSFLSLWLYAKTGMVSALHIELAAEEILRIGSFPVTNTLITSWITVAVLATFAVGIRKLKMVPAGFQNATELLVEGFLNFSEGVLGSREKAEKYLPIAGTIFLFILASNWLGIFPGIGSIEFIEARTDSSVPLFRSAASDLNFTLALGVIAVLLVNISAVRAIGLREHLSKFFTFKSPILAFVGILEFISEFAKIISFSFRLFGNVFAGEVLLLVTAFVARLLIPNALSTVAQSPIIAGVQIPFLALEVFVGFVQALVFAVLTLVFISIATAHH